jgi:galactokinase
MPAIDARKDPAQLREEFIRLYGATPRLFRAPGRVNLIGEHTDYNEGFVLPIAIDRHTLVAAAARDDRRLHVRSSAVSEALVLDLDHPSRGRRGVWFDYLEGVAQALIARGKSLTGANLLIESNVPMGAGLSSSAALEVSVGLALLTVSNEEFERRLIAVAGRDAEHNYVGIMSGIMDQYVSTFGRTNCALLIDCRSLESSEIHLRLPNTVIVVCDTHVKHELASSEYNLRRSECEEGVRLLQAVLPGISALRDVSAAEYEEHRVRLPETIRRRCRHVITENARTLSAAEALDAGDLKRVGELMAESHNSLRDDYEVSCRELDLMVEIAGSMNSVIGSRMTGGGFGGSTVNLVVEDQVEEFRAKIVSEYRKETGMLASTYVVTPSDGASEIAS